MAGADEGCQGLAWRRDEGFLKGNALVARQHRFADADEAVAVADGGGHMGNLIAARLPLAHCPPKLLKRFEKERLDVVRLQPAGIGALHVFADAVNAAGIH